MQVVNKIAERHAREQENLISAQNAAQQQKQKQALMEIPTFRLDRLARDLLIKAVNGPSLRQAYGAEMITGAYWPNEQEKAVKQFWDLVLRDRQQIKELIIDEYEDRYNHIYLPLPSRELSNELTKEANKLGLSFNEYLRAIFYTRVMEFIDADRAREEAMKNEFLESLSRKIPGGYISKALADALEKKYGPQKFGWVGSMANNYPIFTYWEMMIQCCEESLGIKK